MSYRYFRIWWYRQLLPIFNCKIMWCLYPRRSPGPKAYSIYHELNRYGHHLRQRASQLSIFAPEHWNNVRLSTHTLLRRAQLQWFNVRAPHVPRQHAGRPVWDTFRSNLGVCHECYAMPARSAMIPLLAVSRRYVWSVRVVCILTNPGCEMKMKATTFVT